MVDLEARVDAAVEADTDGQQADRQPGTAAGVGGGDEGHSRAELADAVDDFARDRVVEAVRRDHPVGHVGDQHGEEPHGQVGQRRYETVLLWHNVFCF